MSEDFDMRKRAADLLDELIEIRANPSKARFDAVERILLYRKEEMAEIEDENDSVQPVLWTDWPKEAREEVARLNVELKVAAVERIELEDELARYKEGYRIKSKELDEAQGGESRASSGSPRPALER